MQRVWGNMNFVLSTIISYFLILVYEFVNVYTSEAFFGARHLTAKLVAIAINVLFIGSVLSGLLLWHRAAVQKASKKHHSPGPTSTS